MRSPVINGNFDYWTHLRFKNIGDTLLPAVAQGGYWADRFGYRGSISTVSPSRQRFSLGQTEVPGNPRFFYRTYVHSISNPAAFALLAQDMPRVDTFANQLTTLFFWAKADAVRSISVEIQRDNGSGPGHNVQVLSSLARKIQITTNWALYRLLISMPKVTQVIGSNDDDYFSLVIFLEAGSNYNTRTLNLGQQSGIFDFSRIGWLPGDLTTHPDPFSSMDTSGDGFECLRYAQMGEGEEALFNGNVNNGSMHWSSVRFGVPMRAAPDYVTLQTRGQLRFPAVGLVSSKTEFGFNEARVANASGPGFFWSRWLADAEFPYTP